MQKIARGGMSSVYKGLHSGLEQDVAIKVLSPESFGDPCLRDRFITEAKIQARLSHPNVIKTLNYIEQDGTIFMVMEYINGESLDVLLKKIGSLPVERAVVIFLNILDAVEFMHSKGIIHRDIKPANIMLAYDRYVKVMDFGIAKVMGEEGKTQPGIRIGTLWYMSPEQIRGEEASALTDIYSLGITLYQMLTGRVPFTGELEFDVMKGHLEGAPELPWKINKEIRKELGEVILRAIAKKPKDRYQSIREFSEAIKAAVKSPGPDETRVFQIQEGPDSHALRVRFFSSGRRVVFTALVLSAVVLIASALLMIQFKGKEPVAVAPSMAVKVVSDSPREVIKTERNSELPSETVMAVKSQLLHGDRKVVRREKTSTVRKGSSPEIAAAKQSTAKIPDSGKLSPEREKLYGTSNERTSKPEDTTGWSIRK